LLLLADECDDAIRLARLHTLTEGELAEFRRLAGFSAAHPSGRAKRPYYIAAPEYVRNSAGTRAMYLLCHHLNSLGEDAYVYSGAPAPGLNTPLLTDEVKKRHFAAGLAPIAVYPEIVHGNPLAAPSVARYLLNHPGLIGGPKEFPASDAVYFYNGEYTRSLPTRPKKLLQLPLADETIFHLPESDTAQMRQGKLVYPGRFTEAAERHPELFRNATVITQDWPETREALADLMRRSELLYCFSNSAVIQEALLCGCPVVVMPSPLTAKLLAIYQHEPQRDRPPGMALDTSPAEIERARQSIAKFRDLHVAAEAAFQEQLRQFIADTQDLPVDRAIVSGSTAAANADRTRHSLAPSDESYHHWMKTRALEEEDGVLMADTMAFTWTVKPRIQLVVRCRAEQSPSLADTLDSLNFQFYSNYRIDIFASFDAPEALRSATPALGWHVVDDVDRAADAIAAKVTENACDWIVELPPGALLDPQYLFRIVHQINLDRGDAAPCAYFTDDDRLDSKQIRRQPRFKPEFDPEWLLASDLLGPLVVSADAWSACGGASANATRPWYDLALRLVDTLGNGALRHIAEPVLSLPESLSGDGHAAICAAAVRRHLTRRQLNGKVSVSSADTWSVRYRNTSRPSVTIAIPSADKPEYLEQCIEAILGATTYGDYEILIVATDSGDADVPAVIERLLQHREATVRHITAAAPLNTAHFANTAAAAATGDYLLLLADDVRVTRADWLDVLVSHALRPQVGVVGTLLVSALDGTIAHAGYVPGLGGDVDSPHQGKARPDDGGYLNCLAVSRSVAAVSASCMLVSVADYRAAGGMDEERFAVGHADVDFCLRLRRATGKHCIVLAELPLARLGGSVLDGDAIGAIERAEAEATRLQAKERLLERWFDEFAGAAFWSKHLSRNGVDPVIETRIVPDWHVLPMTSRRIMAFPIRSAQGQIRVTQPLQALKRAGQAQICLFTPSTELSDIPLAEDLARHRPDTIVTHQFIGPDCLAAMRQWRKHMRDTFLVYSVDDLMTQMPIHSSLRLGVPADTRSYLSRAQQCSDRLIVSTDHLAEAYGHLAQETCVVPNRLERDLWVPLQSGRRSTPRPRVGWAGGTAHAGDLQVIAELVAATAQEVDWIFMGMCPDNIRPHVREFHPFGDYRNYPQRLAALNLDLAVAPLEQIPFNRGKSNLRLLEYGILGIPVICTDIDPYRDSPACKVPNRPQAWLEALRARIHDLDATAREGDSMRQWVLAHYILEDHLEEWMRAYSPS
jgi:GT2 family glycosyltransferase/glycosyltransferase involved in cell wall biosynthesis